MNVQLQHPDEKRSKFVVICKCSVVENAITQTINLCIEGHP